MLTNHTRAILVQVLQAISPEAVRLLFLKHFDIDQPYLDLDDKLRITTEASAEQVRGLLIEILGDTISVRRDAPHKGVFDSRVEDLNRRLRTDGFEVVDRTLTQLAPAAGAASQISDYLESVLSQSTLDQDGAIREKLRESHDHMSCAPPDLNGSTIKARIALETIARRAASSIATTRGRTSPNDIWGAALNFLRTEGVITQDEENAISTFYKLISPGAHVPTGLTDEQWAILARTFVISSAYFLTQKHSATTP